MLIHLIDICVMATKYFMPRLQRAAAGDFGEWLEHSYHYDQQCVVDRHDKIDCGICRDHFDIR